MISENDVQQRGENNRFNDGVVILARDPKNRHDIVFNENVKLMKEENDVTEESYGD